MRIKIGSGLLPINIIAALLVLVILLSLTNVLRIILGIPFLLLFPGYTLVLALFPNRESMGGIERITLSFGMSVAIVSIIGLALNYTPWGIRLEPVLFSVTSFTLAMSIIAGIRLRRRNKSERYDVSMDLRIPFWHGNTRDRVLSIALLISIVGALGVLAYLVAVPKTGERFTEFYVLGLEDKADDYPKELLIGEEARVTVGIINREQERTEYQLEIRTDGQTYSRTASIWLANGQKWEEEASFSFNRAGNHQKVEFLLYKGEEAIPYLELHMWLDIVE